MWYLVLSRRKATPEEMGANIQGHLAWMQRQHQDANVLFSGPTTDRTTGIYVVRADSVEQARSIADTDPFHELGLREYEMLEWEVHQILGAGSFIPGGIAAQSSERS